MVCENGDPPERGSWEAGMGTGGCVLVVLGFALHMYIRLTGIPRSYGEGWDTMAFPFVGLSFAIVSWGLGVICSIVGIFRRKGRGWAVAGLILGLAFGSLAYMLPGEVLTEGQ